MHCGINCAQGRNRVHVLATHGVVSCTCREHGHSVHEQPYKCEQVCVEIVCMPASRCVEHDQEDGGPKKNKTADEKPPHVPEIGHTHVRSRHRRVKRPDGGGFHCNKQCSRENNSEDTVHKKKGPVFRKLLYKRRGLYWWRVLDGCQDVVAALYWKHLY
jgi:hypothetical protein